jgi:secretion/DNA translocation related CpaE-like protein
MTRQRRPLLLTADSELLDQLLGLAAAVGVAVDVAVEPAASRPQWTDAPLVLLGVDLAGAATAARLGARAGVLLVMRTAPAPELPAIAAAVGAERVVDLSSDEAELLERLADVTETAIRARVIGVMGGRGGAGASVLATGLALSAAGRGPSWLIDLDPLGGGADTGLGAELSIGARWSDLGVLAGRLSPHALRSAVPEVEGVAVVAAGGESRDELTPDAVRAVVSAASRGGGTVVVDLGRNPTAARDEAIIAADDLLLVVPAELRSLLAARRALQTLGPSAPTPRLIVRPVPGGLPGPEVARALGLAPAGDLPDEVVVRAAIQVGDPTALRDTELAALCEAILLVPTALEAAA